MVLEKFGHKGTDNIDLQVVLACPVEGSPGEVRPDAGSAKRIGDFGMKEGENVAGQSVFEVGNSTIALEFKAAGGDEFGLLFLK